MSLRLADGQSARPAASTASGTAGQLSLRMAEQKTSRPAIRTAGRLYCWKAGQAVAMASSRATAARISGHHLAQLGAEPLCHGTRRPDPRLCSSWSTASRKRRCAPCAGPRPRLTGPTPCCGPHSAWSRSHCRKSAPTYSDR